MPNFKLSRFATTSIENNVVKLCDRMINYASANFPLDVETIQSAVLERDLIDAMAMLAARGVQGLPARQNPAFGLWRTDWSGLARGCVLRVLLPRPIYMRHEDRWLPQMKTKDEFERHTTLLDTRELSAEDVSGLVEYANRLVSAERKAELCRATVNRVLSLCNSTGEVLARWPWLASLCTDTDFRQRFRNPPRSLTAYVAKPGVLAPYEKRMAVTETILTGIQMLDDYKRPDGAIGGCIEQWLRIPGDWKPE